MPFLQRPKDGVYRAVEALTDAAASTVSLQLRGRLDHSEVKAGLRHGLMSVWGALGQRRAWLGAVSARLPVLPSGRPPRGRLCARPGPAGVGVRANAGAARPLRSCLQVSCFSLL